MRRLLWYGSRRAWNRLRTPLINLFSFLRRILVKRERNFVQHQLCFLSLTQVACDGEVYSFPTGGELTVQNLDYVLTQPDLGNIQLLQTQGNGAGRLEAFGLLAFLSSLFIFFF